MAQTVSGFLDEMAHPRRAEIDELRAAVRAADARFVESVKWNAPSFALGEHFLTFRIRPGAVVQLVFHTGAAKTMRDAPIAVDDPTGLLAWVGPDRATMTFPDSASTARSLPEVARLAVQWSAQL